MGALFVMDSANNTNNLPVTLGILPAFTGWVTPLELLPILPMS